MDSIIVFVCMLLYRLLWFGTAVQVYLLCKALLIPGFPIILIDWSFWAFGSNQSSVCGFVRGSEVKHWSLWTTGSNTRLLRSSEVVYKR